MNRIEPTKEELAWLAGFIEGGSGSFGIRDGVPFFEIHTGEKELADKVADIMVKITGHRPVFEQTDKPPRSRN